MDVAEPGSFADRAHPSMSGASIQPVSVTAPQDRPLDTLGDREVDRACGARDERDDGGLVALANDSQRSMPMLECKILDVGRAGLRHAQAVQTHPVVAFVEEAAQRFVDALLLQTGFHVL